MPIREGFEARPYAGVALFAILAFYLSSRYSYLLFHSLIEIATAAVGFALFALTWNARRFIANGYLKILGIGYGFLAFVDLIHALAYKGMNIFPGYDANLPTQLWIAARYAQAATLCAAPLLIRRRIDERLLVAVFAAASTAILALTFAGDFPDCFIEGQGLTPFKIGSEYAISVLLLASLVPLHRMRHEFNRGVYRLIVASILCTALSELSFTAYASVYGFANMLGHLLKLAAFYLIYRALLVTGFGEPFDLIFRDLKLAEERLQGAHDTLEERVRERTAELRASEAELRRTNRELRAIGNCHKTLLRADQEPQLLDEVCRIVCDDAGYRMAWVGYAEHDEARTVRPVAWGGTENGYLAGAHITWADTERGRGPTGIAIRSGRSSCIQDFEADAEARPWRESALQRGYRSSIALPLKDVEGLVFGVLCIYSTEANTFTDDEVRLLEELAADLAFGIVVIHARAELRRAEEQVRALNRDLERRVLDRTRQLEAANKELEAFSYSVSHDLRAPLRAIDGFSQIVGEDYRDRLDDTGRHYLDAIRGNAARMDRLINDILAFSRMSRQEMSVAPVNMQALVQEVFDELRTAVPAERRIELRLQELPAASGDRALIRQVIVNLLSNALKFTAGSTQAVIEVTGSADGADNVYCVRDNGAGFDMQYANKLFGVFQRLHRADEFEGTGIGLAIVKRIVVRHGGRVWAEGEVGRGASFYWTLPRP
ncbi:MAG TPA: MASE3 domain-containing protein [Rhodocyclaceae bacterium]